MRIPTYENGLWSYTEYTRDEFRTFIESLFKEPGKYEFDESTHLWNQQARIFEAQGFYCAAPLRSKDYIYYWENEKEKCRFGVIFKNGDKSWYLTRDYYMWINFLRIYDKISKKFKFPQIWDTHYHMSLYELLAELNNKHAVVLKKRQIGSSYFHLAKLLNTFWFEEGAILKMGGSLKKYINDEGSWKFLNEYKDFLNANTAWYRPLEPDKVMSWQQRIKQRVNNRDSYVGLKSVFNGTSFEKDPTAGVGGPCTYFFHEEAGIAPKMGDTYQFMKPALRMGDIITGQFIAAGSVGELDQCEPLKKFLLYPEENEFFGVESNLIDSKGTTGLTGLFIPEQWSMPPFIDDYGNSLVEKALESLEERFTKLKKDLTPQDYQLNISQHPRNIEEAFASRKISVFPTHLVNRQLKRIEEKEYPVEYVDLYRDETGIKVKYSNKLPIDQFPIVTNLKDKEGVICIYERPSESPVFGEYYASIDPISEGKTTTSDSLCAIYIYKNKVEVTKEEPDGTVKSYIEGDKIVASWCGRFDDINKTHERLELMIEWYNAWTIVEANISLFIQYMIARRKQRYLVPRDQILFLKDLSANSAVYQEYGWKNTGNLFKTHLISYGVEFIREVTDSVMDNNGNILKNVYGIERIPDKMLLVEMGQYQDKLNVDRLVAFCSLVAFVTIQNSNRGYAKRRESSTNLENTEKMSKLSMRSPFKYMGKTMTSEDLKRPRSPFKNIK
jgi:hypothetical protein